MSSPQWKAGDAGSDISGGNSYNERNQLRGKEGRPVEQKAKNPPPAVPFEYGLPPEDAAHDWGRSSHINKAIRTVLLGLPNVDRTFSSLGWKH